MVGSPAQLLEPSVGLMSVVGPPGRICHWFYRCQVHICPVCTPSSFRFGDSGSVSDSLYSVGSLVCIAIF